MVWDNRLHYEFRLFRVAGCTGAISDDLDTLVVSLLPEAFEGAIRPGEASRLSVVHKVSPMRGSKERVSKKQRAPILLELSGEDVSRMGGGWEKKMSAGGRLSIGYDAISCRCAEEKDSKMNLSIMLIPDWTQRHGGNGVCSNNNTLKS